MPTPTLLVLLVQVAAADTMRAPGTLLRLGWPVERVERLTTMTPATVPDAREARVYQGTLRVFGLPGRTLLYFEDGRLSRARFTLRPASERTRGYVEDELRRMGYGATCSRRERGWSECDWKCPVRLQIKMRGDSLTLDYTPKPPPVAALVDSVPPTPRSVAVIETLGTAQRLTSETPRVIEFCRPIIPEAARAAGVFGRVTVAALVDTSGVVLDAQVVRGIAELDSAALACARRFRFEPPRHEGRPVRTWIPVPVVFTLP